MPILAGIVLVETLAPTPLLQIQTNAAPNCEPSLQDNGNRETDSGEYTPVENAAGDLVSFPRSSVGMQPQTHQRPVLIVSLKLKNLATFRSGLLQNQHVSINFRASGIFRFI